MNDHKAPPSSEQSLKYMAWDIKQISENIKLLTQCVRALAEAQGHRVTAEERSQYQQTKLPF